jgi:probable phosphoglycerate mutase
VILYFARHGESVANTGNIISNRDLDHPLTPTGRLQAEQLAQRLADAGISTVYCSPVPRALETAAIVSRALNLPLQSTDALREFDCGVLEGRSGPVAWMRFSLILRQWFGRKRLEKRFRGGESFLDVRQRFMTFIDDLVARHAGTDERIQCITHGGTLHIGLTGLLSDLPFEEVISWSIPYTAVIKTEFKNGKFMVVSRDEITRPLE